MEPVNLHKRGPGALVLQNGRQAGARRPLGVCTTFIGRSQGCDIRLNVDGVEPMHCLLVVTDGGVQLRDLDTVHGTLVNDVRADKVRLTDGDLLRIGPFHFRLELASLPTPVQDNAPVEESRDALRIQAAAVAAQQIALEEEEARLQQRRNDLQQQEEQLAAHLDEKQRQVQLWSDHAEAERETLRQEKLEQEKRLARIEAELLRDQQEVGKDQQKLVQERQRIHKLYQRLRQRWQRQWSAAGEKHQTQVQKLHADALALDERQRVLADREAVLARDILRFNTERELGTRELRDGRASLTKDQETWRRRRSHEFLVLKGMQHRADETQLRLKQARQLLVEEKDAWDKQLDILQKELHGLNNRVVHQRSRIQEQTGEIARLDGLLRERQLQANQVPAPATEVVSDKAIEILPDRQVVAVSASTAPVESDDWRRRFDSLDHLAGDLADQRVHLIEQYQLLAEIQEAWQHQRSQASVELEALAKRLVDQEQALVERDEKSAAGEELLRARQQEVETLRAELQVRRAELSAREQAIEQEYGLHMHALDQMHALLQEQLAGITTLRQRWNQRRQQEVEQLRVRQVALDEQQAETHRQRQALFEKSMQIDEEKRILAEKALALEQYRQDVSCRTKDPAAQSRVERLRRRWLTLNAALIRNSKAEHEAAKKSLLQLETRRADLHATASQQTQLEAALAERQVLLEEQEAMLSARQTHLEQEFGKLEIQRHDAQSQQLRLQDVIDNLAKSVYEEMDQAA